MPDFALGLAGAAVVGTAFGAYLKRDFEKHKAQIEAQNKIMSEIGVGPQKHPYETYQQIDPLVSGARRGLKGFAGVFGV